MKVQYFAFELPFRYPFTISKGTKTHQPTLVVELEWNGVKGYGEAPAIAYYHIPVAQMIADLEAKRVMVERYNFTEPDRYWHYLHHLFPQNSFLVCALDMAYWDLYGKVYQKPLHTIWKTDMALTPICDYTIGIDNIEKMVAKMLEKPWPIYKIKMGGEGDMETVRALRAHTDALFRVDVNAGWTLEQALEKIPELKELGVEFVEQPLAKDDWEGMKLLYEQSVLPLVADEACVSEQDVDKCKGYFHGINIKLTKCGGITPARRMIANARKLGMKVMMGCMNESTIGAAAVGQFLPQLDYVDMDGPLLLAQDIASGLQYDNGKVTTSGQPGLGIDFFGEAR
jgi:L-Ala-D/L-Glu epimerase